MSKKRKINSGHRFLHGICLMCGQSERGYDAVCQPVPSKVVATYICFDSHQQHQHSWHSLQDCLEELRKIETKQADDSRKLAAVRARLLCIIEDNPVHAGYDHSIENCGYCSLLAIIDAPTHLSPRGQE